MYYRFVDTPLGRLRLIASEAGLAAVLWPDDPPGRVHVPGTPQLDATHPVLEACASQLADYFSGRRTTFKLALDLQGTPFQRAAWQALADIPFGATETYAEQARRIGRPTAARAIGAANGRNPVSIILPCHRVIGADGSLTGFAGGIGRKEQLLAFEAGARPIHSKQTKHSEAPLRPA